MNRLMAKDPMTLQYLNSVSEPAILDDQPTRGMSDEEELRRWGLSLDGIGEEVLVDLRDLGIITDD